MERPIFKPIGSSIYKIDTPALVINLNLLNHNIKTLHSFFKNQKCKVRPFVSTHMCPSIAHKQIAAGNTSGISVSSLSQANLFAEYGFGDIFITNKIVSSEKIKKLCSLAKKINLAISVDSLNNIKDLSEAAKFNKLTLNVAIDINHGLGYCGVAPGSPAVELAKTIESTKNLRFIGLTSYENVLFFKDREELIKKSHEHAQQILDTRERIERLGLKIQTIMIGSTHNYDIVGKMSGVTEVPAGSYVLMDSNYIKYKEEFSPAARILATVTSRPEPSIAILDTGQKTVNVDSGLPITDIMSNMSVNALHAEHTILELEGLSGQDLKLKDKVWLIPSDITLSASLNDYFRVEKNGKLEAMWNISARGRYK